MKELHLEAVLEKVSDFQKIASYGIMQTPGLVIDKKVVISGFVPTTEKKELLFAHRIS